MEGKGIVGGARGEAVLCALGTALLCGAVALLSSWGADTQRLVRGDGGKLDLQHGGLRIPGSSLEPFPIGSETP